MYACNTAITKYEKQQFWAYVISARLHNEIVITNISVDNIFISFLILFTFLILFKLYFCSKVDLGGHIKHFCEQHLAYRPQVCHP